MKVKQIINLCGHAVNVLRPDGTFECYPAREPKAMISHEPSYIQNSAGLPLIRFKEYVTPETLPPREDGVLLIVSGKVFYHPSLYNRYDLVTPYKVQRECLNGLDVSYCQGLKTHAYY